jgi:hypothetical protein
MRLKSAWVSSARRLAVVLLAAAVLAGPAAQAQELLRNGSFEQGGEAWSGCGGVDVSDLQDPGVTPGRRLDAGDGGVVTAGPRYSS